MLYSSHKMLQFFQKRLLMLYTEGKKLKKRSNYYPYFLEESKKTTAVLKKVKEGAIFAKVRL